MNDAVWNPALVTGLVTAALALIGVLVGHHYKNRESIRMARVEVQRVEVEQQRADIDGLTRVVESLKSLVELQEKRITALTVTVGTSAEDLDHEREYVRILTDHIEANLPPPPPPRPKRNT